MKKFLIFGLVSICLMGCACAVENIEKGSISVTSEETMELDPTTVKISFSIETKANNAQTATELNKKASQNAINSVKSLIDTNKKETMKTTSFNIHPEYSYKDGQNKLIGYRASNTLQVTLKDVEKAGKIISTALANGANSVSGLQFILDETNDACNSLIQKASKNARLRADKVAESIGTSIAGIRRLNTSCSANQGYRSNFAYMNSKALGAADEMAADNSIPIEVGKNQIRATVSAEFYVK